GHGKIFGEKGVIGAVEQLSFKNLRCLHGVKLIAIHRAGNDVVCVGALESVLDRLGQRGGAVNLALLENPLDLSGRDQRTRSVVHSDVSLVLANLRQARSHGILSARAPGNYRPHLFEMFITNDRCDFGASICAADDDDFIDTASPFKGADCVRNHGLPANRREQFVESHAATFTSSTTIAESTVKKMKS